ncbi:MAG: hypothetical protein ACOYMF_07715 [Bacteroidales bacterium]
MKNFRNILLITLIAVVYAQSFAQDKADTTGPAKTIMSFTCTSTSNDSIVLKSQISVRHDDSNMNLMNAKVRFSVSDKDSSRKIGLVKTGYDGVALLKVSAKKLYFRNSEGMITFKAEYAGEARYEASEGEFGIKPGKLTLSFYEEDSVKYIKVNALQLETNGKENPLGGQTVLVYIPRMLSLLKITEITLDSLGEGTAEFPTNIFGDSIGNLTVIAQIEENDIYGNVRSEAKINWGLPKRIISTEKPSGELWTPIAPLWMIITLIIMLVGVWSHYAYTVIQLYKIKKIGIEKDKKESTGF